MKKLLVMIGVLLATAGAGAGEASGEVVGYIPLNSGTDKILFVRMQNDTDRAACNTTARFTMKSNNPKFESTNAVLMAALFAGTTVRVKGTGSCSVWANSEDISYVCVGDIPC